MAKAKNIQEKPVAVVETPGAPEPLKTATAHTEARVLSGDLQLVRTYSKEIHGEKFEALAFEFATPRALHVVLS